MHTQQRQLSTHSLPWPTDWPAEFGTVGQARPLIVEIGFGYGQMLFHLAEQFPDANIIGVEVASKPIETVERRLIRRGVANVRVVYGYAETLLHHALQPASVQQIHVNFPDPWFKSGHVHRRLMKRPTVDAITSRLVPGGMMYLATDIDEYAEMSHELLTATPGLTNHFATPWAGSIDNRVTTKYEAKAVKEGRTNKYFAYRRNDSPAPDVPVIREIAMPNLVFESSLSLPQMVDTFERTTESFPEDDIHVSVMHAFVSPGSVLYEVYVKEATIEQHVGFLVVPRQDKPGTYTLKLSSIGHPRPTEGMHRAAVVIEGVIKQAGEYRAIHRKVRE